MIVECDGQAFLPTYRYLIQQMCSLPIIFQVREYKIYPLIISIRRVTYSVGLKAPVRSAVVFNSGVEQA
jgi:hypothetical protein